MNYASYTRDTTEPLKRLVHGRRFSQIIRLIAKPLQNDTVLDYGCGDAHLFSLFLGHRDLIGYDPNPKLLAQAAPEVAAACFLSTDIEAIKSKFGGRCSLIYCTEVCEHLTDMALGTLFANIKTAAAPNARIVFGVPIEIGLSGPVKSIYRAIAGREPFDLRSAIKSLFGIKIDRKTTDTEWFGHHTGFNHAVFREQLVASGFDIRRSTCLPVPFLGSVFNNEIYFVCSERR